MKGSLGLSVKTRGVLADLCSQLPLLWEVFESVCVCECVFVFLSLCVFVVGCVCECVCYEPVCCKHVCVVSMCVFVSMCVYVCVFLSLCVTWCSGRHHPWHWIPSFSPDPTPLPQ